MILDESLFESVELNEVKTVKKLNDQELYEKIFDKIQERILAKHYKIGVDGDSLFVNARTYKAKNKDGKPIVKKEFLKTEDDYKDLIAYLDEANIKHEFKKTVEGLQLNILLDKENAKDVNQEVLNRKVRFKKEENLNERFRLIRTIEDAQQEVDDDLEKFGRIGGGLYDDLDDAGFYVDENNKVQYKVKPVKEDLNTFDYDKLQKELEVIPNVTKVDFDKDLVYDTKELVVLVNWHSDSDTAQWFRDKVAVKTKAIEVFKNNGLKLSDPVEDNGDYYYFVLREITPKAESLKESIEDDNVFILEIGIANNNGLFDKKRKLFKSEEEAKKVFDTKAEMLINEVIKNNDLNKDEETSYKEEVENSTTNYDAFNHIWYLSDPDNEWYIFIDRIYDNELDESLKEELSPEKEKEYGLTTLINSLIKDELEAIDGYNSAIVTLEAENKGEFTDVIRDIISEENTHIGQLQAILKELNPSTTADIDEGQKEGQEQIDQAVGVTEGETEETTTTIDTEKDTIKTYKLDNVEKMEESLNSQQGEWLCQRWPNDETDKAQLNKKLNYLNLKKKLSGEDALITGDVENIKKFMKWLGLTDNRFKEIKTYKLDNVEKVETE